MAKRRRKVRRIVRKMTFSKKLGKMEWELFILVMLVLILSGTFAFF